MNCLLEKILGPSSFFVQLLTRLKRYQGDSEASVEASILAVRRKITEGRDKLRVIKSAHLALSFRRVSLPLCFTPESHFISSSGGSKWTLNSLTASWTVWRASLASFKSFTITGDLACLNRPLIECLSDLMRFRKVYFAICVISPCLYAIVAQGNDFELKTEL